jgi:hypothetical protein
MWGNAMSRFVLTAMGLLACGFYLYVLIHWMQETLRKKATGSAADDRQNREPQGLHIVSSERAKGRQDRFAARSVQPASAALRPSGSGLGCRECERSVYETIARSWNLGKRL